MASFDIESLLDFKPAHYQCEKCLGLIQDIPITFGDEPLKCPVCGVVYQPSDAYRSWQLKKYLKDRGYYFELDDLIKHTRTLASISKRLRRNSEQFPPLRALFLAVNSAKHYIHFTTYGISHLLIGALKLASQNVQVRGIVSNVDANTLNELTQFQNEAPDFKAKAYGAEASWAEMPHQKLIVIDGLLAFKGSANLTLNAWRKSAKGRELLEVETNVNEVVSLHNRLFSPLWVELSDKEDTIEMVELLPF